MKRKYDENGIMNPDYLQQIKQDCIEHDIDFYNNTIIDIDEYFEQRRKVGWPNIKTWEDLQIECWLKPFTQDCLNYLENEVKHSK